jgi:hypothetical protein
MTPIVAPDSRAPLKMEAPSRIQRIGKKTSEIIKGVYVSDGPGVACSMLISRSR